MILHTVRLLLHFVFWNYYFNKRSAAVALKTLYTVSLAEKQLNSKL